MADRVDFYFRQRVTEAELDLAFALLEKADRDLAADLNIYGIVAGAVPAPHSPVPDLTVGLTAPARAYDNLGQRMFFGTGQTVDCAVDLVGIPTDVATVGNERWLGIFLRFKRLLSDPRTDGNSQQVFFRRDESFELVVRQAPEGAIGVAPKAALQVLGYITGHSGFARQTHEVVRQLVAPLKRILRMDVRISGRRDPGQGVHRQA
jgi:hypothetical protein